MIKNMVRISGHWHIYIRSMTDFISLLSYVLLVVVMNSNILCKNNFKMHKRFPVFTACGGTGEKKVISDMASHTMLETT